MAATVIASAKNGNGASSTLAPFAVPPGTVNGDLVIVAHIANSTSGAIADSAAKGWWTVAGTAVNSRNWGVYARIYNSADPASVYNLTMSAAATEKSLSISIRDHGVTNLASLQIGATWLRQSNGGSQTTIISPSIPALKDTLAIALTGEQLVALETYAVTAASGFTLVDQNTEGPTTTANTEWITAWQKPMAAAGATGNLVLDWSGASLNGVGMQIGIPGPPEPETPSTGNIGAHISPSPTHDSLTVGVDRLGGTAVVAVVDTGAGVVRKTMTIDATSGWGHAVVDGLAPNTECVITFEVDGVAQTDASLTVATLPTPGAPASFTMVTGSCQFTGSNHPIWDRIREDNPIVFSHMGDLHYADASTLTDWRAAVEASLTAPRMRALLETVPMTWTWDNHDRIIADDGGAGIPLNFGRTDPVTNTEWRRLAGATGWSSSDTGGRTWVIGRVRFIQTDNWTAKTDPDAGLPGTPTFLGAAQKQWFKDTLDSATEPIVIWLAQWTTATTGSGRWDSYISEKQELEAFINARPELKARMVMLGGDSHSIQVTDGSRTQGNFVGIPSLNISGFNKSSATGHGGAGWTYDGPLRASNQPEPDWGGYGRVVIEDSGAAVNLRWDAVRVAPTGVADVMFSWSKAFGADPVSPQPWDAVYLGGERVDAVYAGGSLIWP